MTDLRLVQYRPLVRKWARYYYPQLRDHYSLDDLIAEGTVAVWRSTSTWSPDVGATFGQYARAGIKRALRSMVMRTARRRRLGPMIVVNAEGEEALDEVAASTPSPDQNLADLATKKVVRTVLAKLPLMHRLVLRTRFFDGKTLDETGQLLGVTRERARQIESQALRSIRKRNEKLLAGA